MRRGEKRNSSPYSSVYASTARDPPPLPSPPRTKERDDDDGGGGGVYLAMSALSVSSR